MSRASSVVSGLSSLGEKKNDDVIKMFVDDSFPKDKKPTWGTNNLKIRKEPNGWSLVNYNTPLLYRDDKGKLSMNTKKYSVSTTKIQNQIKGMLDDTKYKEVSGDLF